MTVSISSSKQHQATLLLVHQVDLDIAQVVVVVELLLELPEGELQLVAQFMVPMVFAIRSVGTRYLGHFE